MPRTTKSYYAILAFIAGYLISCIIDYFVPTIIDTMELIFSSTTLTQILYLSLIIIYLIFIIVLPISLQYIALMKTKKEENTVNQTTKAVIQIIFSIIITGLAYYTIPILASATTTTLLIILFYIGLIINWTLTVIIQPIHTIIKSTSNQ